MGSGIDAPLNETGMKQAEDLAAALSGDFDIIISSTLKRASQTAEVIKQRFDKPLVFNKLLEERSFGSFAGKSWDEIEQKTHNKVNRVIDAKEQYNFRPYGGESVEDVRQRLVRFIEESKRNYHDKIILVVTHGGIVRLAHHLFSEKTPHVGNVSVHEFNL